MTKNMKMAEGPPWAERLVRQIGAAAKRTRGSRSATWLAERTAELGHPISATIISKLDSGHRGDVLSVPELLVLAAALDIPPSMLLFGDGFPGGETEYLPGRKASNFQAAQWFSGESPMPAGPDGKASAPNTGTELVAAVRRCADAARNLADLATWVEDAEEHGQSGDFVRDQMQHNVASLTARIAKLQQELEKGGQR
jgi:hypothetical protein